MILNQWTQADTKWNNFSVLTFTPYWDIEPRLQHFTVMKGYFYLIALKGPATLAIKAVGPCINEWILLPQLCKSNWKSSTPQKLWPSVWRVIIKSSEYLYDFKSQLIIHIFYDPQTILSLLWNLWSTCFFLLLLYASLKGTKMFL